MFYIDISMFQLFNNKIEINSVDLEGVTSNINSSVSVFNFDYIIKAFSSLTIKIQTQPRWHSH
jgi:tRNA A37 threonylcarbamoyladenosine dehydratase